MPLKNTSPTVKCCIIGSCGVGKTSIIHKYMGKKSQNTETTLGAIFWTFEKETDEGYRYKIDFWDTAGQERYNSLIPMYSRNSDIMIVTFDITERQSLIDLDKWINSVSEFCQNSHFILVGNKNDRELYRRIFDQDVKQFLKKNKNMDFTYFETSANSGYNINELFTHITNKSSEIISKRKTSLPKKLILQDNDIKNEEKCCIIL